MGKSGGRIEVRRIVARDPKRDRGPHVPKAIVSSDVDALLKDPEIDVVVEVAGGVEPAGDYVRRALEAGKAVVTARSEERRVGKECPSKCRSRWSPYH